MIKAIVYKSKTGHTLEYAKMLSKKLNVPIYDLKKAKVNKEDEIIYMGYIMASNISGFSKAKKKFNVKYVIAVGAYPKQEEYIHSLKNINKVGVPLFYLRGRNRLY